MDIDVFPNSIEYWGPSGMVFFRNVQVRWMPIQGDTPLTIALERPGASGDQGNYADRVELDDVAARFPLPDLSAEYRHAGEWGYVEVAGIVRYIEWDDLGTDQYDLCGRRDRLGRQPQLEHQARRASTVRLQVVYGEGIENYMNDATVDIGIETNPGNADCAGQGRGPAGDRHRRLLRPQLERQVEHLDRLLDDRHRQHRAARRTTRSQRPVRPGQPALHAGAERHAAAASCSGASARTSTTAGPSTTSGSSSRSSTTSHTASEATHERSRIMFAQGGRGWSPLAVAALRAGAAGGVGADAGGDRGGARTRPTPSTRTSRKARTPTTSRRSPRSTPNIYGIALVTVDGKVYTIGDIKSEVSIQSISKVFTMAKVMEEQGAEAIENNMGVDATGQVVQLDRRGRAVQGRRDERHGQPGRDHRDEHGQGRDPRRDLEQDPRLLQRLRRAARCR